MTRGGGASEKQVKQWIAKFDVHARGCSYHPFFQVRDVPSKGRSAMAKGQKTERTHHFVSDLEYQYFILAEFAPSVFDILEQYPLLPREETISIAKELGIKHPCYPGSNTPIVMTTDMVLCTGSDGSEELEPLSIKYASALRSAGSEDKKYIRTIEKLQIEKRYWMRRGPWFLCTDAF